MKGAEVGSRGLRKRSRLYNIKVQREAASAGVEATVSSPGPAKGSNEGGYTRQESFEVDGKDFYREKVPCSTFSAREKSMPSFSDSRTG